MVTYLFLADIETDRTIGVECEPFGLQLFEIDKLRFVPHFPCIGWERKVDSLTLNGGKSIWRYPTAVKADLAAERSIGRIEKTNHPTFTVFTLLDGADVEGVIFNLKK